MPNLSKATFLLLQTTLLDMFIRGDFYGIPPSFILHSVKHLGYGFVGTAISQITDSGFENNLFLQFFKDSRNLHLWILSSPSPEELTIRLFQYIALESIGVSFGSVKSRSGVI